MKMTSITALAAAILLCGARGASASELSFSEGQAGAGSFTATGADPENRSLEGSAFSCYSTGNDGLLPDAGPNVAPRATFALTIVSLNSENGIFYTDATWGTALLKDSIDPVVVNSSEVGATGIDSLVFGPGPARESAAFGLIGGTLVSVFVFRRRKA